MNGARLGMLAIVRDLLGKDVDQPEDGDADDRRDDQRNPRDAIREGIKRVALQKGCVGVLRGSERKRDDRGKNDPR